MLVGGMILCPPWVRETPGLPTKAAGYSFWWNAPPVVAAPEPPRPSKPDAPVMGVAPPPVAAPTASGPPTVSIDVMRLISQLGLAVMMTGVAMYVIRPPRAKNYGSLRTQVKHNLR